MMMYRYFLRLICTVYYGFLTLACFLRKKNREKRKELDVLITGTFYSDNWLITHLKPLSMSSEVRKVKMVSTRRVPDIENVEALYPPDKLTNAIGEVPSRLLYFSYVAIKERPDIVAGFHLLINGLLAILIAKIIGQRSMYICGGGAREVEGGGYNTESKIFNKLNGPDYYIERLLLKSVNKANLIVVMGTGAVDYFKSRGVEQQIEVIPGGFDSREFSKTTQEKIYDLIIIGRLSKVKRIDIFLNTVKILNDCKGGVNAVIVGDGPDFKKLHELADKIGISDNVSFVGWKNDVNEWLRKSKIFVLTSESEGLSQALIQAMMTGLPAVVTDVGDLSDLVKPNANGYLIEELDPNLFSKAILYLLNDSDKYELYGRTAERDAKKYGYEEVAFTWNHVLLKI
jgi:glycosyltransferase involved in cell wall biosynthesis